MSTIIELCKLHEGIFKCRALQIGCSVFSGFSEAGLDETLDTLVKDREYEDLKL